MLRSEGVEALQQRLRRDLDNARWLAEQVEEAGEWALLAPVQLQTLCIQHRPAGLEGEALDAHTKAWAERLNASGDAYVTPATLNGRWMVRVSVGALPTEREHVEKLWGRLQEVVKG
jgi:aromatic-L-amino-acid decarboxylase